jgi:hypothetical protein
MWDIRDLKERHRCFRDSKSKSYGMLFEKDAMIS